MIELNRAIQIESAFSGAFERAYNGVQTLTDSFNQLQALALAIKAKSQSLESITGFKH
jgi:hypothetical protein